MIHVDRASVPVPADLDGDASAAVEELVKVLTHHNRARVLKAFPYRAYKRQEVIDALNLLFHEKCAYCESPYKATQPMDVEHYRPKEGIAVRNRQGKWVLHKPGYYWLGAWWENLLPSCIDCNRRRKQKFHGGASGSSGKANLFPTGKRRASPFTRARLKRLLRLSPAALLATITALRARLDAREAPLLLNPCRDQPDEHLEFQESGAVRPLTPRGKASIEVFGLHRRGLASARRDLAVEVRAQIKRIKDLELKIDEYPEDPTFEQWWVEERTRLKRRTAPDSPYAGMVCQLIERLYDGPAL